MNDKLQITYEELFFISFFSIITIGKGMGLGADNKLLQISTCVAFMFISIKLFISRYTVNEAIIAITLLLLGIVSYFITKRQGLLLSIITIIGLKNISIKKLFSVTFFIRLFIFSIIILLALIGIIENKVIVHWREDIGFIKRYALGFSHPNLLHSTLFILIMLYIYNYYEKLTAFNYVLIMLVNILIYNFSGSRTGYFTIIFSVMFTIYIKSKRSKHKYNIIKLILPICVIFTMTTGLLYGKLEFIDKIDSILTGRIYYTNYFLNNYSFSLFGNNLFLDENYIDNSYIILLANYGIVAFIVYLVGYIVVIKRFIKSHKDKELLMISLFSIYGVTEGFLNNIFMNLSLVFLVILVFRSNQVVNCYHDECIVNLE